MSYVIKDTYTSTYFVGSASRGGWFDYDIERARTYLKRVTALRVIQEAGHHVTWPGNRILEVVKVHIKEVYDDRRSE